MRSTTGVTVRFLSGFACLIATSVSLPAYAQKDTKKHDSSEGKSDDKKSDEYVPMGTKADGSTSGAGASPSGVEPPAETYDIYDVNEVPGKSYFFVGMRYRGNVIPQFMINMFVDEGTTVYTNQIGVEFDLRKDGFSIIPALSYHDLNTGNIIFKQKNTPDITGNWSLVNSTMKNIYASVDLLWSTKLGKNVDFEYGAGFGLGAVFGPLETNWVKEDPTGLPASNGKHYVACATVLAPGTGCNKADHQNSQVNKVGGYNEPTWFDGGSKPVVFPWIAVPQLGLRFKPIKQMVGRLGVGFALTGFWFGLSADYGLEKKPQ
jgi:hypothetical protein